MIASLKKCLYIPLVLNVLVGVFLIYTRYFSDGPTAYFGAFLFLMLSFLFIYDIFVGLLYFLFRAVIRYHGDKLERFENAVYALFIILLIVPFIGFYIFTL